VNAFKAGIKVETKHKEVPGLMVETMRKEATSLQRQVEYKPLSGVVISDDC
jgi:hypothetical protein